MVAPNNPLILRADGYPSVQSLALDPTSHLSIPLGIIIGLLASFVQSLGLTIQRKSHVLNQLLPEHRQRVEHRRPLWLFGFAIFISSNILGSLVQIASLPVVILAPLGAVSLLWNAFFARLLLGDVFSPWMILGTILIAGGAILIAVFGIVPEPTRSLEDLLELFRRPAFVAYFSVLGFIVVVSLITTHLTEFSFSRKLAKSEAYDSSLILTPSSSNIDLPAHTTSSSAGVETNNGSTATERTPLLDGKSRATSPMFSHNSTQTYALLRSINRTRLLVAISYASFSGILSGMCLIFAKSGVELLLLTLGGQNQFWRWESWVLVLGLVVFALLQLWYLHKALILADPTLVCPSAFCFYNLSSIVNGLVYFDQLSLIRPLHLGLVILGIFVLLGGVWVVSIHAGGGGVDIGNWSEENIDADVALCEEPQTQQYENGIPITQDVQDASKLKNKFSDQARVGPVPMERETRSESNLPQISASPEVAAGSGLRFEHVRSQTEESPPNRPRRRSSVFSESSYPRPRADTHTQAAHPVSPSYHSRFSLRHRSTIDQSHSRTTSHLHSNTFMHGPLSPPLNPVSTLGSGFQIGLSPISPGFAIVPRERKRKMSGLGLGAPGFADVVMNASRADLERRRTVSEGDFRGRAAMNGGGHDGSTLEDGIVEEPRSPAEGEIPRTSAVGDPEGGVPEGRIQHARKRWKWLKGVIRGRGKE